jgi:hypothetical protein
LNQRYQGKYRKYSEVTVKPVALAYMSLPDPLSNLCPTLVQRRLSTAHSSSSPVATVHEASVSDANTSPNVGQKPSAHIQHVRYSIFDNVRYVQRSQEGPKTDLKSFSQKLFRGFELDGTAYRDAVTSLTNALKEDRYVDTIAPLSPKVMVALSTLRQDIARRIHTERWEPYPRVTKSDLLAVDCLIAQSIFYTFADAQTVIDLSRQVFSSSIDNVQKSSKSTAEGDELLEDLDKVRSLFGPALSTILETHAADVFDCLWKALESLFHKPQLLGGNHQDAPYLNDEDAVALVLLCVHAITAEIYCTEVPGIQDGNPPSDPTTPTRLFDMATRHEEARWNFERLQDRLARAIGARVCFQLALTRLPSFFPGMSAFWPILGDNLSRYDWTAIPSGFDLVSSKPMPYFWTSVTKAFMILTQERLIQTWTGDLEVNRWGVVGCHLEVMSLFCEYRFCSGWVIVRLIAVPVSDSPFSQQDCDGTKLTINAIADQIDVLNVRKPAVPEDPNIINLLDCLWLFPPEKTIERFRAINLKQLDESYVKAISNGRVARSINVPLTEHQMEVLSHAIGDRCSHLHLEIRRGHELEDALDQLWHRDRQELTRPLHIRFDNEPGVDIGGVSQEFFSTVFNSAFDPDYGESDKTISLLGCKKTDYSWQVCSRSTKAPSSTGFDLFRASWTTDSSCWAC